ncbi:MAG: hypothetical protein HQM10_25970 [Candidatus Riflebacteria bacterium]|nr:hypothetical protein [Candidatus Riflebacteria bacterium]
MTNPFDLGRTMLETWEKSMSDSIEKISHDENFLKNMSQLFSKSLDMKKVFEAQMEKAVQKINLPTKTDIERVLVYLQRIEERLLDLEDSFAAMQDKVLNTAKSEPSAPSQQTSPKQQTVSAPQAAKSAPAIKKSSKIARKK